MNFVDHTVIAHTDSPCITSFELFRSCGAWIRLQFGQPGHDSDNHLFRQTIQFLLNRFRQDNLTAHFPLLLRPER